MQENRKTNACTDCGSETNAGVIDDDGVRRCIPCGHKYEKENHPETYNKSFWRLWFKIHEYDLERKRNPPPPIIHNFKPGDFVIDKGYGKQVYKVENADGDYLAFDQEHQSTQRVGSSFRGKMTLGRADGFRLATPEEIGNRNF